MPSYDRTVDPPKCLLCAGLASPPSRMGWLSSPERQAVFVCCGACSDCSDKELEDRIIARVSELSEPEPAAVNSAGSREPATCHCA
jgi:hypothetical protein